MIFLIFITIEIILIILYLNLKKHCTKDTKNDILHNRKELENIKEEIGEEIKNNTDTSSDYYFEDYTKHVTVYKNGNGIILQTFDIVVNNPENFKEFKRKINVEDGKKDLIFPSLSKMKATPKEKRFETFGFWVYKPSNSIINRTTEKYWADNDPEEIDHAAQRNNKELRWVFEIKRNKVKNNQPHKMGYAISIPGFYPIEKGRFVKEVANEPDMNGRASTSIHVEHYIKKITYIVSFEEGIKFNKEPECFLINGERNPIHIFEYEEGIFYNKYIFTIDKPSYGTNIIIKWEFKGGNDMDKEGGD